MGHKYYNLSRRVPFIQSVSNMVHNTDKDYEMYSNKIYNMITDNNINKLGKELLLKPNIVISIIANRLGSDVPLLSIIGSNENVKMFDFFLDFLLHYCNLLVFNVNGNVNRIENDNINSQSVVSSLFQNKKSTPNPFLKKYLNYNRLGYSIVDDDRFWGLSYLSNTRSIESIMKLAEFGGLNQINDKDSYSVCVYVLYVLYMYFVGSIIYLL